MSGRGWIRACRLGELPSERGVVVLLPDQRQAALFRLHSGDVVAVSNRDPRSGSHVMARGLVGTRAGVATLSSPLYRDVFDLSTGRCLNDDALSLDLHRCRICEGFVWVAAAAERAGVPLSG